MVDILFSAPVISCLLVAACAAFGVSVIVGFTPQKRKLQHTIGRAEKALKRLREEIASKESTIKQLQSEVDMLKPLHTRLSGYHEDLMQMHLDLERKEMAEEDKPADEDEDEAFGRRKRYKV